MADFKIDETTGDLALGVNNSTGLQLHTNDAQEASQRIAQALTINIAEWFSDVQQGVPYLRNTEENVAQNIRYLLGNKLPAVEGFVSGVLTKYILDLPFVKSVIEEHSFNRQTRVFTYEPRIEIISGAIISFPPLELDL